MAVVADKNAGNMATFSVTASQGSAHLAYQWTENGTNISGATSPAYTTGMLLVGDNGDTFSLVVSLPGTSETNVLGPVTLTVVAVPPQVLTVGEPIWSTNSVLVIFQEPVNPVTATNLANYGIDNGATLLSAVIRTPTQVYLTTSPLVPGTTYTLTVKILMGHDGPGHIAIAEGKTKVRPLQIYHGKVGRGLSVEMCVRHGPVTLLSAVQTVDGNLKFLMAEGESAQGPILEIGNTNSRYRFKIGARKFVENWNLHGPAHHCAVGVGHVSGKLQKLAALLGIEAVRVC